MGKGGRLANTPHAKGKAFFHVFPGFGDILFREWSTLPLPEEQHVLMLALMSPASMMIGMTGTICGTANLLPRLFVAHCNDILEFKKNPSKELLTKIEREQEMLSRVDWALNRTGIVGTKWVLEKWYYPMGPPRRPLQRVSSETAASLEQNLAKAVEQEKALEAQSVN